MHAAAWAAWRTNVPMTLTPFGTSPNFLSVAFLAELPPHFSTHKFQRSPPYSTILLIQHSSSALLKSSFPPHLQTSIYSDAPSPADAAPMESELRAGLSFSQTPMAENQDDENMSETSSPDRDHGQGNNEQSALGEGTNDGTGTDPKPAWSELKTKAGKERKRLPLACIACRRKKIRCSGEKPACKHCQKSRIPCVYKVTTRKAAPRTDYMAMLDKRLKRMEERVIKIIPAGETRDMDAIGRSHVRPTPAGQTVKQPKANTNTNTNHQKRSADEAFLAKYDAWIHPPQVSSSSGDGAVTMTRETKSHEGTELLTEGAEFLPSMEIQEHLSEVFFDCVYGQSYLLLHRSSFMRRLKAGTVPPVLILAVCAVSARFSTHPQINAEPAFLRGENWARPAAKIALSRHDEPNITILTAFLLLGLHEFGTCHGGRSWSFGGQALRMAYALQLHQEVNDNSLGNNGKSPELSFTDKEIRRRTMWACYLMDRYNSSGSQRPPIGNEKFIQIQLPVKESLFLMEIPGSTEDLNGDVLNPVPEGQGQISDPKANMGVSAYIIRTIVIWGHIVDYLNLGGKRKEKVPLWDPTSKYTSLRSEIETFAASLPSSLVFTQENLQIHAAEKIANQFIFLHIIIHQNILFLNQFAIPLAPGGRPPKGMPKSFLSDAGRAAVEAAHHISMLIDQASGYSLTVPFAGYCAYSASTVHIWGIFSKNAQLEARSKENLRHTYRYLNKMKRYWGMFHYMVESAKDRYRQFADATIRGLPAQQTLADEEAPSMFQYGDWFDKYPHGVSPMHWEDPNTNKRREIGDDAVMGQRPDLQSVEEFFASLSPSQQPSGLQESRKHPRLSNRRGSRKAPSQAPLPQQQPPSSATNIEPQSTGLPRHISPPNIPQPQSLSTAPIPDAVIDSGTPFPNFSDEDLFGASPQSLGYPIFDYGFVPDFLPQLDRQFVQGAYTGLDLSGLDMNFLGASNTKNDNINEHHKYNHNNNYNNNDPTTTTTTTAATINTSNSVGAAAAATASNSDNNVSASLWTDPFTPSGTGEFAQPSAWFLPFNLDPLTTGMLGGGGGVDGSGAGDSSTIVTSGGQPEVMSNMDGVATTATGENSSFDINMTGLGYAPS